MPINVVVRNNGQGDFGVMGRGRGAWMRETGRRGATSVGGHRRARLAATLLATALICPVFVSPARANLGYELAKPNPVLVAGIEFPHGVAVDQANHRVYVAVVTDDSSTVAPGEIRRFESNGSAAGTFTAGAGGHFSGVAVNPVTQAFYGAEVRLETPLGNFGTSRMDLFSSAGVLGTQFPLSVPKTLPQIATNSAGDVYFPNAAEHSVQVFNSAGVLQEEIGCGGCPGGAFGKPVGVAVDSADDLYVADLSPDRVVKLTVSGGLYGFDSILQSGRGAAAVGVDPSTNDVFVGDFPDEKNYHVVAYDSSGAQFDDFGAGLFIDPPVGVLAVAQIAADATTHKLYVSETNKIYVFERVTISPPAVTTDPVSGLGQLGATLNASVNANGHAVLKCDFEYTDDGDFQATEFADATVTPCSTLPDGSGNTAIDMEVSGLLPATTYHFRVTAANNAGPVSSTGKTFKTLPAVAPTVTTEPPLAVTQTGAKINGKVNPHGGSVSDCHFELGTSLSYGDSVPCPALPGPVTTGVAESGNLAGLAPGTAYHYRLVVSTNAGTSAGNDVEFKTVSAPSSQTGPASIDLPPVEEKLVVPHPLECGRGFRHQLTGYGDRCVKVCHKGFQRKKVRGKVRCVKVKHPKRRRFRSP